MCMLNLIKKSILTKYSWFLFDYRGYKVLGLTNPIMDYLSPSFVMRYFDGFDKVFNITKLKINGKNILEDGHEVIVVDFRLFETLTLIEQKLLLEHEIYHIQQNHLNAPDSIDIEFQADKEAINSFKGYDYSNQMVECLIKCVNYSIMRREHLRSTGKWIKDNSFISDKDLKQMIQMRIDRIKSN